MLGGWVSTYSVLVAEEFVLFAWSVQRTYQVCLPFARVALNEVSELFSVDELVWLSVPSIKMEQFIVGL